MSLSPCTTREYWNKSRSFSYHWMAVSSLYHKLEVHRTRGRLLKATLAVRYVNIPVRMVVQWRRSPYTCIHHHNVFLCYTLRCSASLLKGNTHSNGFHNWSGTCFAEWINPHWIWWTATFLSIECIGTIFIKLLPRFEASGKNPMKLCIGQE